MQENENILPDTCNFRDVQPIMMNLPYPPIQVRKKNKDYANILSFDYCGSVSEMSAITQYINNENRLSCGNCDMAKTILGIAMAEMIHLQKLGQLIFLLGGTIDFSVRHRNGKEQLWTPEYIDIPEHAKKDAVSGYRIGKSCDLSVPHAYADDKRQLYQCRISKDHQR